MTTTPATGPSGSNDRRLVLSGLGWSALGYPLNVGLGFIAQVLAARVLLPDEYGTFSVAFSFFTVAGLVAALGLPSSLLRRASAAIGHGQLAEARHEILSAFVLGGLAALVAGLLIGSPLGEEALDASFPETAVATVAVLLGLRTALRVLENVVPEALRSLRDFLRVMLFDGLVANAAFVVGLAVMLLVTTRRSASVSDVLAVSAGAALVSLVPAFASVRRRLRDASRAQPFRLRNSIELSMWASTIGRAVIAQLDLLVVGALADSRDVALYAAPFRIALLVGFPLIAVNQVVTPLIAGWYAKGQLDRLERTLRGTAGLALLGSALFGIVLVIAGRPILELLFGETYGEAWGVLVILVLGQVLQTWAGSCGFALMMTGHQRWYAWMLAVSAPVTLALDVGAYELMGIEGVALATTVMLVAQNAAQVLYLRRRAGFSTWADPRATLAEVQGWRRGDRPG